MPKILVNAPSGKQEVIVVGDTGGYFDESLVIWDERKDGPLPEVKDKVGGLVRKDGSLEVDSAKLAEQKAAEQAEKDRESQKTDKIAKRKDRLKKVDLSSMDLNQLKAVIKDILEELNERS